jgi:hypothetical protein
VTSYPTGAVVPFAAMGFESGGGGGGGVLLLLLLPLKSSDSCLVTYYLFVFWAICLHASRPPVVSRPASTSRVCLPGVVCLPGAVYSLASLCCTQGRYDIAQQVQQPGTPLST